MTKGDLLIEFTEPLLSWYDLYGRKDLPWQKPRHPYRVWVSEIMLQQTQVQTVVPYFNRFISRFPDVSALAQASEDEVLSYWSGLGYYSRARNLHRSAQIVHEKYKDQFPRDIQILEQLPGIGPSTAAAILSQAFNEPTAILDANVKRVISRYFKVSGLPDNTSVKKQLWALAQACMHLSRCADYTQAIMDLGATCCTNKKPKCNECPLQANCQAFRCNEQDNYPNKKIKKPKPCYSQQFITLLDKQNCIYLDKRPPTGLWGGLWCLPSIDLDANPVHWLNYNKIKGQEPEIITQFKHSFSHFDLQIKAILIRTESVKNTICETNGKWFSHNELSSIGLAKPTSIILNKVFTDSLERD